MWYALIYILFSFVPFLQYFMQFSDYIFNFWQAFQNKNIHADCRSFQMKKHKITTQFNLMHFEAFPFCVSRGLDVLKLQNTTHSSLYYYFVCPLAILTKQGNFSFYFWGKHVKSANGFVPRFVVGISIQHSSSPHQAIIRQSSGMLVVKLSSLGSLI